jgi:tyrosine-specific transport protein
VNVREVGAGSTGMRVLGGASLVGGTCIGAGMLGLPVETGATGLIPSVVVYFICWLFMTCTGLMLADICLANRHSSNFLSLSKHYFGRSGLVATSVVYLLLFFSLMVAYSRGGAELMSALIPFGAPRWMAASLFVALLGPVILLGSRAVAAVNGLLILGLATTYVLFAGIGSQFVKVDLLVRSNWGEVGYALPMIVTAFGFQGMVPTLVRHFGFERHLVRRSILFGSGAALIVYVLWQWLIIGCVPFKGEHGLAYALDHDQTAIACLQHVVGSSWIFQAGRVFGFFALASSYLGVGISLIDFVSDGTGGKYRLLTGFGVLFIPFILSLQSVGLFYGCLRYGGGAGCLILLGLLPILYARKSGSRYHPVLLPVLLAVVLVGLGYEIAHLLR